MFSPTEADKMWLVNLLSSIRDGGIWGTDWAVYQKVSSKELEVLVSPGGKNCEENIDRVRIVCNAIGVKFTDRRKNVYS